MSWTEGWTVDVVESNYKALGIVDPEDIEQLIKDSKALRAMALDVEYWRGAYHKEVNYWRGVYIKDTERFNKLNGIIADQHRQLDQQAASVAIACAEVERESDHHIRLLANALGECIQAAGITAPGVALDGPMLLMFADDLKRHLEESRAALESQQAASIVGEWEAFEEFDPSQWWYLELEAIAKTADQRRAMAVVRNLMRQFEQARPTLSSAGIEGKPRGGGGGDAAARHYDEARISGVFGGSRD